MGIIKVKNIRVYAYHGCLDEEGKIGSEYRVDLSVKADLKKSAKSDELRDEVTLGKASIFPIIQSGINSSVCYLILNICIKLYEEILAFFDNAIIRGMLKSNLHEMVPKYFYKYVCFQNINCLHSLYKHFHPCPEFFCHLFL